MTFTAPRVGPCEPYTTWEAITACPGVSIDLETDLQDLIVELASETVWGLLGERFTGGCERTVMPCWSYPCGCVPCGCSAVRRLDLGALPVWGVSDVTIDGESVDNTLGVAYRVEDWRYLVWLGGPDWPRCQGGWEVTYTYGTPIPVRAQRAAALLGAEFAKQCAGLACGLDPQTTSYSREGVTVQLSAPADMIASGTTGIVGIDLLLGSLGGRGHGGGLFDVSEAGRSREVSWTLVEVDA